MDLWRGLRAHYDATGNHRLADAFRDSADPHGLMGRAAFERALARPLGLTLGQTERDTLWDMMSHAKKPGHVHITEVAEAVKPYRMHDKRHGLYAQTKSKGEAGGGGKAGGRRRDALTQLFGVGSMA